MRLNVKFSTIGLASLLTSIAHLASDHGQLDAVYFAVSLSFYEYPLSSIQWDFIAAQLIAAIMKDLLIIIGIIIGIIMAFPHTLCGLLVVCICGFVDGGKDPHRH